MPDLLIRDLPEEINARLEALAKAQRRSKEKQAMVLIEMALAENVLETGPELLAAMDKMPVPDVDVKEIDSYLASRGRRSRRP
jgi:plasmid stability protein